MFTMNVALYGLLIVGLPLIGLVLTQSIYGYLLLDMVLCAISIPFNLVPWYAALANMFMAVVIIIVERGQNG